MNYPDGSDQTRFPVASPCVQVCRLNQNDVCVGCGRTLQEIAQWTRMTEDEKARCVERAAERHASLSSAGSQGF
ncbi:MAG: DUF1289 domain-containing protein [Burkholderiales bacterium]|nr:DUF1289 domain-containing protein [Burkholderiales bacterium]MDE2076575.1 DUF1289 domain-containing protein [Burkholderiales bacterium]MDE2433842.1 DUF1289 domain-containing protein [Burkholderiales bacterium]